MVMMADFFPKDYEFPTKGWWFIPGDEHLKRLDNDAGNVLTRDYSHPFIVVSQENDRAIGYPRSTSHGSGVPHRRHVPWVHQNCSINKDRKDGRPAKITLTRVFCDLDQLNVDNRSCEEPADSDAWAEVRTIRSKRSRW